MDVEVLNKSPFHQAKGIVMELMADVEVGVINEGLRQGFEERVWALPGLFWSAAS